MLISCVVLVQLLFRFSPAVVSGFIRGDGGADGSSYDPKVGGSNPGSCMCRLVVVSLGKTLHPMPGVKLCVRD